MQSKDKKKSQLSSGSMSRLASVLAVAPTSHSSCPYITIFLEPHIQWRHVDSILRDQNQAGTLTHETVRVVTALPSISCSWQKIDLKKTLTEPTALQQNADSESEH